MKDEGKRETLVAAASAESLYKSIILEHSAKPHHFFALESYNASATKNNMLCGDEVTVYCRFRGEVLEEVSFTGTGCAIMKASASLMTEAVREQTREGVLRMVSQMTDFVNGDDGALAANSSLRSLAGVRGFPSRIKCALLPFQALHSALAEDPRS